MNKIEAGAVTWGLKSLFAHTPQWAKNIEIAIIPSGATIIGFLIQNPTVFGAHATPYIAAYAGIATLAASFACKMIGVRCPLDKDGNPVTQPADRPAIGDGTCETDPLKKK